MPLLEFRNVSKTYNNITRALDDISFSVKQGEFVSVIGSSGAGKSTMLRCVNRLIDATSGEIIFDGKDVTRLSKKELRTVRTQTGMIFQHYNLVNRLSVIENILHGRLGQKSVISGMLGLYTEQEKEEAFEIINLLGLGDQAYKRCDELSGGQKQRVGIARAIMQRPKLIMCDEPIASLDPNSAKIIMDHLKDINRKMNITCLVNLHQVDVAVKYSDRIIGVNGGKIVFDGDVEELNAKKIHKIYGSKKGELITDVSEVKG
ncbi:MAG: phosphonate ABC transporter ATP-binding protein [Oscillospiraceae bacterium]|jgi:phosphonate transport system ATP-binding protein